MVGETNTIVKEVIRCDDPHTLFLMTDSVIERSMYKQGFETFSGLKPGDSYSYKQRDNRNTIYFNGSSGIRIGNKNLIPSDHDWTLECWILTETSVNSGIFWQQISSGSYGFLYGHSESARLMYISTNNSSWNICSGAVITNVNSHNQWKHQAIVHSGNTYTSYTNGTQVYSVTNSTAYSLGDWFWIGRYASTYITAYMQDIRISDVARYTSNFTPPERFLPA